VTGAAQPSFDLASYPNGRDAARFRESKSEG